MADALRPSSLLLGAICLWAISILLLAMTGLGSHFPEATSQVRPPAIPVISLTRSQSRLGPMANYLEVGERPLLTADRRPAPVMAADGQAGAADLDVTLTSVLITPRLQLAILTDNKDASTRRVRVGETVSGSNWRLIQLAPRSAVIEGPSGQRTLELRVFDGKGGQAPTPTAVIANPEDANGDEQAAQSQAGAPPQNPPPATAVAQSPAQATQDQQVESIRRRIEARRAQMRAEAAAANANEK